MVFSSLSFTFALYLGGHVFYMKNARLTNIFYQKKKKITN
jgi:hypothetical protein